MPRGPRISYPHAIFHVINRFVDRHPFFKSANDYAEFLNIYYDEAATFGIWTYAHDLMPNHFHIILETPSGEISRFLQRWLTRAAQSLNRRRGRVGHLFQGRSKTLIVEKDRYFSTVIGYVLTNRVRAGLAKDIFSDPWNSVSEMLSLKGCRLARGPLWEYLFGHEFDERRGRAHVSECRNWLSNLQPSEIVENFKEGHRGSFLSTAEYRAKLLDVVERRKSVAGRGLRRKTDRHLKSWTWAEIRRASAVTVDREGIGKSNWRSREDAIRQISWYVAHVGAGWTWDRILEKEVSMGSRIRPNRMAVLRVRRDKIKKRLADQAIASCLSARCYNVTE